MDYNIAIGIGCTFIFTSFFLVQYSRIRMLKLKLDKCGFTIGLLETEVASKESTINARNEEILSLNEKLKKPKSKEILEILNDLNRGETLLSISRVDQDNVYFHQSGR